MMNGHFFRQVLTSFSQLQNKSFARRGKDVYIRLINVQIMKKGTYKTCKTTFCHFEICKFGTFLTLWSS